MHLSLRAVLTVAGRVPSVGPAVPGVDVRLLSSGAELELVDRTATEVLVPGCSDEPHLPTGPGGVGRDSRSPPTYRGLDPSAPALGIGCVGGGAVAARRLRETGRPAAVPVA